MASPRGSIKPPTKYFFYHLYVTIFTSTHVLKILET